jgi:predicted exporter
VAPPAAGLLVPAAAVAVRGARQRLVLLLPAAAAVRGGTP